MDSNATPTVAASDVAVGPESTLMKASAQLGKPTIREIQAEQARARTAIDDAKVLTPEREKELDGMTLEELAKEIRDGEERILDIETKRARAKAKIDEIRAYVDGLRMKYELANRRSDAELAVEYLECQKKERVAKFKEALRARGVIEAAGVDHIVDLHSIGLGVSPADQAIAADIKARRYVRSKEAQAKARR